MASYDEFVRAAQNEGLYEQFSPYDLQLAQANPDLGMSILGFKIGYRDAPDDETRSYFNTQANMSRSTAYDTTGGAVSSYTAGPHGSDYYMIPNASNNGNPSGSMVITAVFRSASSLCSS